MAHLQELHTPHYDIRLLPMSRPFVWLSNAWLDIKHHQTSSLAYGVLISALGALMLTYQQHPYFIAAYMGLFLALGPMLAAGLCELSRCSDLNQTTDFDTSLKVLRKNTRALVSVAALMFSICLVWFVASHAIISTMIGNAVPSVHLTLWDNLSGNISSQQFIAYGISTMILGIIVFSLSIVTIPMIIDRHIDAKSAILTSLETFTKDSSALLVWGFIITSLVGVAFLSKLLLMPLIFPLLGHATWYAYKDLIKD